jgi:hypothetical protein
MNKYGGFMVASEAARRGLKAQNRLIDAINTKDELGKKLIKAIEDLSGLRFISCSARECPPRAKADVAIACNGRCILISVKEFDLDIGFDYNHVERKYLDFYAQKWSIPKDVYIALKKFVGEVDAQGNAISIEELKREAELLRTSPGKLSKIRRTLLNRMDHQTIENVKKFFMMNKMKILKDVFIGDETIKFFIFVKRQGGLAYYYIVRTEDVINVYSRGDVRITPRGSLLIGRVELQRKGGDHWTKSGWVDASASQLQFKIKPSECTKDRSPVAYEKVER